jgi:nicotinamidase-related amidase
MKPRSRTALLLVDFINFLDFDGASSLAPRAIKAANACAGLKARALNQGMPCIYANDNFGRWTSEFSALTAQCLRKKGPAAKIAEVLRPSKGDLSVLKPMHSALYGTPLEFLLNELHISKLIIAGLTVDSCVFATAQDAHMRKYNVWVPANCVAGFTPLQEKNALAHMARTLKARIEPGNATSALNWRRT